MVHLQVSPALHHLCTPHLVPATNAFFMGCLQLLKVLVVQSFHRWDGRSVASRLGMQVCCASMHLSSLELAVAMLQQLRHVILPGNMVGNSQC